jgi:hypothetical protein
MERRQWSFVSYAVAKKFADQSAKVHGICSMGKKLDCLPLISFIVTIFLIAWNQTAGVIEQNNEPIRLPAGRVLHFTLGRYQDFWPYEGKYLFLAFDRRYRTGL